MAKDDFFSIALYKANAEKAIQQAKGDRIAQNLAADVIRKKEEQESQVYRQNEARKADYIARTEPVRKPAAVNPVTIEPQKEEPPKYTPDAKAQAQKAIDDAQKALDDFDENREINWAMAHERKQYDAERSLLQQSLNKAIADADKLKLKEKLVDVDQLSEKEQRLLDQYTVEQLMPKSDNPWAFLLKAPNALVDKYGEEEVKRMAEAKYRRETEKINKDVYESTKERLKDAELSDTVGENILRVGSNIAGAIAAPVSYLSESGLRSGQFKTLNPYAAGSVFNAYASAVTEQTAENIRGDEDNWLRNLAAMGYQGAMSAVDSAARLAVAAGNPGVSALIAAGGTFGNGLQQYSQQGASPEQAAAMALLDSGIEYATEKISDAELLDFFKHGKDAKKAKDFLWHTFGLEPLSEEVSLFAGAAAELAVLGDKSSQKQRIGELVANGASYQEAQAQVLRELWREAAQTYVISAISAGIGSAGAYELGGRVNTNTNVQTEQQAQEAPVAPQTKEQQIAQRAVEMMTQPKQEAAVPTVAPEQAMANALAEVMGKKDTNTTETVPAVSAPQTENVEVEPSVSPMDTQKPPTDGAQIKGTGAAETGFTPKQALINQYGNIPEGENPVRPYQLPMSTNGEDRVSYTARTALEARVTPDEFVPLIENNTVRGGFSYIPITNDATVQAATQNISREGWQTARANWTANIRAGVSSPEITATGALLYNHAVNIGDHQEAMDILMDYQMAVRNTAQALQAARILKTLTPSDRLYMIRRSVEAMVQDMHLRNPVTINEELAQRYQNAGTQEEADEILREIAQDVARQIPPNAMEAFTALRYLNMLGNFRTQVRNVAGNMGSKLVYGFKDKIGAAIETIADAVTPGGIERTKSFTTDRNTRQAAAADYDAVQDWIMGNGRYDDNRESDAFARMVQENRRMLPPGLEQARRLTNWAMEAGDTLFARDAYARALAGYLNARGIRTDNLETVDPDLLDRAREYAVRQAQEQTFRDNNQVSDFVAGIMRGRNTPTWARVIGEGVMPFRRTLANVLVRAEEYSPLGLINSTVNTIRAAKGEITGAELVDSWAKTLTGTALFAIGKFMAENGVLTGGPDEDEEKDEFDQLNGKQDYALNFTVDGKTYSYTIDWATPAAMPMFMGAQLAKVMADKELTWADMEKALTSIGDPLIQMSMLQGVNDTLENIRYAENNMGQFLINATMSYLTQGLTNTLLGQIERSTEENRQTTYIDKDSNVPQWLQRQLGKASQKIPVWDYQQTDYLNAWGETEKNEGGLLYNLLSPGYISEEQKTAVSDELYRLREATGANVFPQIAEKTVTYTGTDGTLHKDYNLSAEEFDKLQKAEGQEAAKLIAELVENADYAKLTDKQKAEVISDVYAYAREQGKKAALSDYHSEADSWIQEMGSNKADTIVRRAAVRTLERAVAETIGNVKNEWQTTPAAEKEREELYKSYRSMDSVERMEIREDANANTANYLEARDAGVSHDKFTKVYKALNDIRPEKGQSGARSVQKAEAVAKVSGLSEKEKELFVKQQVSDAQDKNINDLKNLWKENDDLKKGGAFTMAKYAKLYRDYEDYTKGDGKKSRTVKKWMEDYNISKKAAESLYDVFSK